MRSSGSEEDTGPHDQEGDSEPGEDGCENSAYKFLGEASLILRLVHKVTITHHLSEYISWKDMRQKCPIGKDESYIVNHAMITKATKRRLPESLPNCLGLTGET